MMAVYCGELNSRVLLGLDSMLGLDSDDDGVSLVYRCVCGRRGRLVTGRDRRPEYSGHID